MINNTDIASEQLVTAEYCAYKLGMSYPSFLKKRKEWGVEVIRLGHRTVRYLWSQVLQAALDHGIEVKWTQGEIEQ